MPWLIRRPIGLLSIILVVSTPVVSVRASESDLSVNVCGPPGVALGQDMRVAVAYRNAGPDPTLYGYINVAIPSGLPAPLDELTYQQIDGLRASVTDTHRNTVLPIVESRACESLMLQIQGPDPPGPMQGLAQRTNKGSLSFNLSIPTDPPVFGRLVVVDPPHMAREFVPALTRHSLYYNHGPPRYASGLNCNARFGGCTQLEDCFGPRLSLIEPIHGDLEVVDGGGQNDPDTGCGVLVGFTPGRIAVVRNGGCSPFEKAFYAQGAGATGVIVVNNGICMDLGPDSPDCVYRMYGGGSAGMIDIPIVMISMGDGEDLITELERGGPVTVSMGAMPRKTFEVSAFIFSADPDELDPNPDNNGHSHRATIGPFSDGFDCGGCSRWSVFVDR